MPNYPIKYVTDKDNNRCLPKTHINAVADDNGTPLNTLLGQKVSCIQSEVSGTSVSQQLAPNTYYSFGTVTSLTITLGTPVSGVNNEYVFEFDSGSSATTLSIPASVVGIDTTSIAASKHYEVSIKYNASNQNYYGLIQEW